MLVMFLCGSILLRANVLEECEQTCYQEGFYSPKAALCDFTGGSFEEVEKQPFLFPENVK